MFKRMRLAVADDQFCPASQNGRNQLSNFAARVLMIAIGVDDNVSAQREGAVYASLIGCGQATLDTVANDMLNTELSRNFYSLITAAIVNDQRFNATNALYS